MIQLHEVLQFADGSLPFASQQGWAARCTEANVDDVGPQDMPEGGLHGDPLPDGTTLRVGRVADPLTPGREVLHFALRGDDTGLRAEIEFDNIIRKDHAYWVVFSAYVPPGQTPDHVGPFGLVLTDFKSDLFEVNVTPHDGWVDYVVLFREGDHGILQAWANNTQIRDASGTQVGRPSSEHYYRNRLRIGLRASAPFEGMKRLLISRCYVALAREEHTPVALRQFLNQKEIPHDPQKFPRTRRGPRRNPAQRVR